MLKKILLFILVSLILGLHPAKSNPQSLPPGGTSLLSPEAFLKPEILGEEYGKVKVVPIEGMSFQRALQVVTSQVPLKNYGYQLRYNELPALKKGDILLVSFHARSVTDENNESGSGQISLAIQKKVTWDVVGKFQTKPGEDWQQYHVPFEVPFDLSEKGYQLGFSYGAMLQTLEIGNLTFLNYGNQVKIDHLPKTSISYTGRESYAPWRKAALERIEKNRKADLTITVKDANGKELPDSEVEVRMIKHEFLWGGAVPNLTLLSSQDREKVLSTHRELFNQGLPLTHFIWNEQETPAGKAGAAEILKYLKKNQMITRAHALIWERPDVIPADVLEMIKNVDKIKLQKRITEYLTQMINTYKDHVDEWIVENEGVDNRKIRDVLGDVAMAEWFKLVRQLDPNAKLMINDNRLEGLKSDKSDRLLDLCKFITENGGDYDRIGIQSHFSSILVPPEILLKHYDKLATTGKKLAITEYNIYTEDEQLKADYTRDIMTVAFSHPSFDAFTIWKFWEGKPDLKESVIFRSDWALNPSGQIYKDLVFNQWWTNEKGKTNTSGKYNTRGYLGEYEITASSGGKKTTIKALVQKNQPNLVEIILR